MEQTTKMENNSKEIKSLIFIYINICFFLSGLCGLIYQVLWSKMLSLIFGHTTFATSTVITAFMTGLALGSYFFGIWADKNDKIKKYLDRFGISSLLIIYGFLEVFIGTYCFLTPSLFNVVEFIYLKFAGMPFLFSSLLRFLLCFSVLILPTICMGGTLPLLSKFFIRNSSDLSQKLGFLYFINTIGAVAGTALCGFYFIPSLGINTTLNIASIINITIGLFIYTVNKYPENTFYKTTETKKEETGKEEPAYPINTVLMLTIFSFTGFASMIYELTWTRVLALCIGSSTYAFSSMLTTFLLGIALGSIIYSFLSKKSTFSPLTFGWVQLFTSISCIITVIILGRVPLYVIKILPLVRDNYNLVIFANFLFCFLVMILPTTLMGFTFPLVGKLYASNIKLLGRNIGSIYAFNTIGCIAGAFLTGFLFIPFLGIQNSLKIAILINLMGGIIFLYIYNSKKIFKYISLFSGIIIILILNYIPQWNPVMMNIGPSIYSHTNTSPEFIKKCEEELIFFKDGISSTVSVFKNKDIDLRVNGKTDASTNDMDTQLLLGYIPALYHQNPENVFIIGFGSGITSKAILDFQEVKSAECAELEPAIIETARYFSSYNEDVIHNPRFNIFIGDGRNALLSSVKSFDIIISEPSNPWISGVGNLFTREFYNICKNKLKPDGIMCQWLQMYSIMPEDFQMIISTFYNTFPEGVIWAGCTGDILLLGSREKLIFDYKKYYNNYKNNRNFKKGLNILNMKHPDLIFSYYIIKSDELEETCNYSVINTDNLQILEFNAPKSLYKNDTVFANLEYIYKLKKDLLPEMTNREKNKKANSIFYEKMADNYYSFNINYGNNFLKEALTIYPGNTYLNILNIRNLIGKGLILKAEMTLLELIKTYPDEYKYYNELAYLYKIQDIPHKEKNIQHKKIAMFQKNIFNNFIKIVYNL